MSTSPPPERRREAAALFETLHEGVVILFLDAGDPQAREAYEYVNDRVRTILGIRNDGRRPEDLPRMLRADGRPLPVEELPAVIAARTGRPVLGARLLAERPDGTRRWLSVNATRTVVDGRPAVVSSFFDDDDRQRAQDALLESEMRLRATLDASAEGIMFFDRDDRAVIVNAAAGRLLGIDARSPFSPSELTRGLRVIRPDGTRADFVETGREVRLNGGSVSGRVSGFVGPDGQTQWLSSDLAPVSTAGTPPFPYVVTFRDITEAIERERALMESEERFRTTFARAPIGMGIIAPDASIVKANQAWADLLGYSIEELERLSVHDLLLDGDTMGPDAAGRETLRSGGGVRMQKRHRRADGSSVCVQVDLCTVLDAYGEIDHLIAQIQDVGERQRHQEHLEHLADHDALTGLLNRRGFQRSLEEHLQRTERYGGDGALLLLDLDHFKYVNDTFGHQAGDELIAATARVLTARLRQSDLAARLGGDEFAILTPHGGDRGAMSLAASLLEGLRTELSPAAGSTRSPHGVSASIGIALCAGRSADELMVNADFAMYDAKEQGRNRWSLHRGDSDGTGTSMRSRASWLSRMKAALEGDGFELHAQPIVGLDSAGPAPIHEVLLRMRGENGELVAPGAFLPIAERVDLIQSIDRRVIHHAISSLAQLPPTVSLSVNVSAKTIADGGLLADIESALRTSGATASSLVVEITETAAVTRIAPASQFAQGLQGLGCRVAIDDFGAGYAAFAYLRHLPFDFLKIDGRFVSGVLQSRTDQLIVQAVRHLAHGLDRAVIAEHCSSAPLADFLRTERIDFAQGFHFGAPRPLAEMIEQYQVGS